MLRRWPPGWQIAALPTYFAPVCATRPFAPQTAHATSRTRHASAPANHPDTVPSTRPYLNAHYTLYPARVHTCKLPQCRAQHALALQCRAPHAPEPQLAPHAVPSTRPHALVPQRAPHDAPRTRPHPHTTLFTAAPLSSTPGGPFQTTLDLKSAWYDATASPLPRTSVRQGVLFRDHGPQVHLVRHHRN